VPIPAGLNQARIDPSPAPQGFPLLGQGALRDATRTLMGSVRLIRDQGLKHRMEEPESFIGRINGLCIK